MKSSKNILYLSLGSNIEDRLRYIKQAISSIDKQVGKVILKAKVYETPSWGFNSTAFLNTCIAIETKFDTKKCLENFQEIEKELGRKPKQNHNYEDRPIDIDIIYSSEGIFNLPNLVVPHPLLHKRKFVLLPLNDILPTYKHPLLHKNTLELITNCKDTSTIKVFTELM